MEKATQKLNYRITVHNHERLMHVAQRKGLLKDGHMSQGGFDQLLGVLLDQEEQPTLSTEQLFPLLALTSEQAEYVFDVLDRTGVNILDELRTGFLARIKSLDKARDRLTMIDLENPDERQRRLGAGEKALALVVEQYMAENDAASDVRDKVYLSSEFLKTMARAGKTTVVEFRKNNRPLFDTHNAKHGWYDTKAGQRHNQMVSRKYRQLMNGEE